MKIVIVGPGIMPIPPTGWGAVEILIWDQKLALEELGHEVVIVNTPHPMEIIKDINAEAPDFVHIQYDDFIEISAFNKYIVLTFLILMLLYTNATLPIIQNLNGFLGIYEIGYIPGLIFTSFVYLSIMNAINLTDGIDGYLAIFSISFLVSSRSFFSGNSSINNLLPFSVIEKKYEFFRDISHFSYE